MMARTLEAWSDEQLRAELERRKLAANQKASRARKHILGVTGFDVLDTMGDGEPRTIGILAEHHGKSYKGAHGVILTLYRRGLLERHLGPPKPTGRPFYIYQISQLGLERLCKEIAIGRLPGVPGRTRRKT